MSLCVEKGSNSKSKGRQKKKKTHNPKTVIAPTGGVKSLKISVFITRCQIIRQKTIKFF